MLEKLPQAVGHALADTRAGLDKLVFNRCGLRTGHGSLQVGSLAFADHAPIPQRYTADAEGVSPPLHWSGVPAGAGSVVLIVEDADAPTPEPLVHAVVVDLAAADGHLAEGELHSAGPRRRRRSRRPQLLPAHGLARRPTRRRGTACTATLPAVRAGAGRELQGQARALRHPRSGARARRGQRAAGGNLRAARRPHQVAESGAAQLA